MRKIIGSGCILLGLACLLVALGFVVYNKTQAEKGEVSSQTLLQSVQAHMEQVRQTEPPVPETMEQEVLLPVQQQMPTLPAGSYESIGILSIPVLELELPVLTDWSYEKLKNAPCLYYGSYFAPDFVIAAHNFNSHFGRLSQLRPGDLVLFTDVTGEIRYYEVVLLETLPPTATEEMITSGFALSLYTCTPGGGSRVTVRCSAVEEGK